ncbi:Mu transposase C-terminal domain-containing protein [Azospira inquinata]|uniref:Transposase n=1 Tax=Azospira inquinata TaxID=2785627 RepID=A0A975SPL6_9RHOO|nr:Mu transposase C-terminal domain-containing protein [Azospira inquinata]QWT47188.1 transposase [Azospira inquinata]QWT50182.1 transposase [Azospira inquinata]
MSDQTPRLVLDYGTSVFYRGRRHVICQESTDFESVMLSDPDTGKVFQALIADISPFSEQPVAAVGDLTSINDNKLAEANRKYEIIRPLLTMARRTKADVLACASAHRVGTSTIYRWLHEFDRIGRVSVFVRSTRKDKGHATLPEAIETVLADTIKVHYLSKQKKNVSKVIRELEALCKKLGLEAPHPNTVRNRIKQLNAYEKKKAREGGKAARDAYAAIKGKFPGADFPLSVVQVDHTPLDIVLVDDLYRLPIGRPWLTLLIDVFSRMVLGFYISFDPPGNLSLGLCLTHAFLPKEKWLAKQGIETAWPCWGIPRTIHADNAKEFRGNMLRNACKEYGIDLEWRPVATPHYGAHIERLLGTLNTEIHAAPGTTFSNPKQKGEYDANGQSAMSLSEFEKWFTILCVEAYHQRPHSQLGMPPIAKWQEGILGTKKKPGVGIPPRITDELRLKLDLMPFEIRTVQHYGIVWDHIEYQHDVLRRWINAPDPDAPKLKRKFLCRRDPRDISTIWFYDPEVQEYYPIPYRNTSHPAISIWELQEAKNRIKKEHPGTPVDEMLVFDAYDKMREIEEQAKVLTKKVRRDRQRSRMGIINARNYVSPPPPEVIPSPLQSDSTSPRVIKPFEDIDDMQGEDDD